MKKRYFIFTWHPGSKIGGTGLGHTILSIFNCAHYARVWGRILVLDMRKCPYFDKDNHKKFYEFFEFSFPEDLDVVTDIEEVKRICNLESVKNTVIQMKSKENVQIKFSKLTIEDDLSDTVLYNEGHLTNKILNDEQSKNYKLKLRGIMKEQVDEILSMHFDKSKTIGVHYRHGNGVFLHHRFDSTKTKNNDIFNEKLSQIKHEIIENVNLMAKQNNIDNPRIYLASDNLEFVQSMNQMMPNSFYITEDLPNTDFKHFLEKNGYSFEFLKNTVVDLWALSLCDHIVCVPSLFVDLAVLNSESLSSNKIKIITKFCLNNIVENWNVDDAIYAANVCIKNTNNQVYYKEMLRRAKSRS